MQPSTRILIAKVHNKPGVLARIAALFRRRGLNIDSLAVAPSTAKQLFSRMTFVVSGNSTSVGMAATQLERLVDVVEVKDITERNHVWRELALIKVEMKPKTKKETSAEIRTELLEIGRVFGAKVVDMGYNAITFETAGGHTKTDAFIGLLRSNFKILEIMRTGKIAILRNPLTETAQEGDFIDNGDTEPQEEYGQGSV